MRNIDFVVVEKQNQKKMFCRISAYQKNYEKQIGKRKTNRNMVRKG